MQEGSGYDELLTHSVRETTRLLPDPIRLFSAE